MIWKQSLKNRKTTNNVQIQICSKVVAKWRHWGGQKQWEEGSKRWREHGRGGEVQGRGRLSIPALQELKGKGIPTGRSTDTLLCMHTHTQKTLADSHSYIHRPDKQKDTRYTLKDTDLNMNATQDKKIKYRWRHTGANTTHPSIKWHAPPLCLSTTHTYRGTLCLSSL